MTNFNTLGWFQLGYSPLNTGDLDPSLQEPVFYNKIRNYTFANDTSVKSSTPFSLSSDYLITAAPLSGPIAITLNQKKFLHANKRINPAQKVIRTYTCAGRELAKCEWPLRGEILADWGFDSQERLVCIMRDATIIVYSIFLKEMNRSTFVRDLLDDESILMCKLYRRGIIILSKTSEMELKMRIVTNLMGKTQNVVECADMNRVLRNYMEGSNAEQNASAHSAGDANASAAGTINIEEYDDSLNFPVEIVMRGTAPANISSQGTSTSSAPTSGAASNTTPSSTDDDIDIILALPNFPSVLVINTTSCVDMMLTNGPFRYIKLRPGNDVVACYTEKHNLWVIKSDFTENETEFATHSQRMPTQVEWCGIHSVALYWSPEALDQQKLSLLLLIGPTRDYIKLLFDGPIHIVPEVDGLRILTEDACEFLYRIPEPISKVFKAGSLDPAAILYEANENYENMDPSAIRNMRRLGHRLKEAVQTCILAAGYEYDQLLQNRLLQSASLGKSFPKCKDFEHDQFYQMIKRLRILNALRDSRVGIPLTFEQLESLSPQILVDRLTNRFEHWLAFEVCKFLGLNDRSVLMHWAQAKVCSKAPNQPAALQDSAALPEGTTTEQLNEHDKEILLAIKSKIEGRGDIPFAQIAMTAHKVGKQALAQKLLELEDSPGEKVSVLLTMGYSEEAFDNAIKSGITDLIYMVLIQVIKSWPRSKLLSTVLENETSRRLLETHALRVKDYALLEDLYVAQEHTHDEGCVYVRQACQMMHRESLSDTPANTTLEEQIVHLTNASRRFRLNSKGSQHVSDAECTRKQMDLLRRQHTMDQLVKSKIFTGKSISETIYNALLIGTDELTKIAQEIIDDFKVNPKRCSWIKVRALAEAGRWEELKQYATQSTEKEGYPPIGFRPFAEECIKYGNWEDAKEYASKVYDSFSKVRLFVQMEDYGEAINCATDAKSVEMLNFIYKSVIDPEIRKLIGERIDMLS